jgi:hypothetical protein
MRQLAVARHPEENAGGGGLRRHRAGQRRDEDARHGQQKLEYRAAR